MLSRLPAGARALGLALLAAAVLTACGSDDNTAPAPSATPAATKVVVDTTSATPVAGGTLTLKATLLAADGSEVKGASIAWASSDESVAVVTAASDKAPAGVSASVFFGAYATVQTRNPGEVDITATATLGDGTRASSVTHLVVQAAPAKSYTLTLSPSNLTLTAGGAAQTVTAAVRRSDGVDGIADLTNWSWTTGDATFPVTAAVDGHSAQVSSPSSARQAGSAVLAACADAPTGTRLCANAALARPTAPPPTYSVGGTVSGLASGKSLQLVGVNGDTAVVSANGAFTVSSGLADATPYTVTLSAQPAGQTCTIQNGSGTIAAASVTNVTIICVQTQFAVVANGDDMTVSVHRINPITGALAAVPGSPFAVGYSFTDIAFLPSGLVGYAIEGNSGTLVGFRMDPVTGALAAIPGATLTTPATPQVITVHPSGKWVFVGGFQFVAAFAIDTATYVPTLSSVRSGAMTDFPQGLAVAPGGQSVYAVNAVSNTLWSVPFDPTTGRLSTPNGMPSMGAGPTGGTVSADGRSLFYVNSFTNMVGIGLIDTSTGLIAQATNYPTLLFAPTDVALGSSFAYVLGIGGIEVFRRNLTTGTVDISLGIAPASINGQRLRIEPNGRYLYAASYGNLLHGFAIDALTGLLTPVPGSPFLTGSGNYGMAIVQPTP